MPQCVITGTLPLLFSCHFENKYMRYVLCCIYYTEVAEIKKTSIHV
jgi:hypothetical protein